MADPNVLEPSVSGSVSLSVLSMAAQDKTPTPVLPIQPSLIPSYLPHTQLDLWYVIVNGSVEISHPDSRTEILCMGNSFGISPSLDKQYMSGLVRTKGDDCQVR